MSGVHARLSASSAHRWTVCAGSVNLALGLNETSEPAAQGTYAHGLAAKCLLSDLPAKYWMGHSGEVEGFKFVCDQEMVEGIQLYLDAVLEDRQPGDLFWTEMDLWGELQTIDKDFGGTADHVRYRPSTKHLKVFDFKYGSGMYVEADSNIQLTIYTLGVLLTVLKHGYKVNEIEIVIVQPRYEGAEPVRTYSFKAVELIDFIADMQDKAEATRKPNAPLVPGEHCTFCPARRTCPALSDKRTEIAKADFAALTDPQILAGLLASIPQVKAQIKAIEEYAYSEAVKGTEIPGFKLVEKRPVRKWKSEGEVILLAQEMGVDPYAPREVLSPKQLEDRIKENAPKGQKKHAIKVLEPFVEKVSSGHALVPVTDDRPPAQRLDPSEFDVVAGDTKTAGKLILF